MKKIMEYFLSLMVLSIMLNPISAQLRVDIIEKHNQRCVDESPNYVDAYPDSLFLENKVLFFCQTPLSLKPGYSGVYLADNNRVGFVASGMSSYGLRGYRLSWTVRNDSLFVNRIYFFNQDFYPVGLSDVALHSRMEKFTGGEWINGLMFINWISGNLRVISKYCGFGGYSWSEFAYGNEMAYAIYNDDRKYGYILTVKNGLVVDFKEDMANNPPGQTNMVQRELDYELVKRNQTYYVDSEPDTLLHDGRKYFFRQSPLSLKRGYTDVYHEDEVSIFNITSNGSILGMKGYHLTWVTRNDSLFISNIYPTYYNPKRPTLCKDTIIARLEAFTGSRFINGLMFVNWVSGIFGIITKHTRNFREIIDVEQHNITRTVQYKDDRKYGSFLEIKSGLITGFAEEDIRKIKN